MNQHLTSGGNVAFQGERGAYSDLACRLTFPDMEPYPCSSFEDAFAAVEKEDAVLAMIPIENSIASRVADIYYMLPNTHLHIIDETFLRVNHCLLAPKGADMSGLKTVSSHPQALAQCRRTISELGLEAISTLDTAGAARQISEQGDTGAAVIASSLAGQIYGLACLRTNIEDAEHNITRFIVLSRESIIPDQSAPHVVTSFMFRVGNVPAALYKAMGGFATRGINLTKLESYIIGSRFEVARFYAEIEAHRYDANVRGAFDELSLFAPEVKLLGIYPAHEYRDEGGRPMTDLDGNGGSVFAKAVAS
jgi:prephenate dehydratase